MTLQNAYCPYCDSDDIYEDNIIQALYRVTQWEDGQPTEYRKDDEYDWTPNDPPYYCRECGNEFHEPVFEDIEEKA